MANRKKSSKDAKPKAKAKEAEAPKPPEETVDAAAPEKEQTGQAETKTEEANQPDGTLTLENPIEAEPDPGEAADHSKSTEDAEAEAVDDEKSEPAVARVEAPEPTPKPVAAEQPGFFPLVLGGIVAAVIGFAASQFVMSGNETDSSAVTELQQKIDDQTGTISTLVGRIDGLEGGADLSAVEAAQSDLEASISDISDRLAALEDQVANIDIQPVVQGETDASVAAYEQELKALRSQVDAMADNAARLEENAQLAAQETLKRAALTRVLTALDAGVGFEPALADLESLGVEVPASLASAAAGGVPSLTDLQESFPDAARVALSVSRDAGGSDGGGFTSFLRSQLGARSLNPREGSDPDAVLSRVEAAIHEGRLSDALAEIEALPEEGRAELSEWSSAVARRQDAVSAAQTLSGALN